MKEGLPGWDAQRVTEERAREKKIDVCLLSPAGEIVDEWASPPDADGLRGLAARAGISGGGCGE